MQEIIFRILERCLRRFKGKDYRLDRSVPTRLILGMVIRRCGWLLRGAVRCLLTQGKLRFVYLASGVQLRNASLIEFGAGVTVERGATIDGLSHRGLRFGDNVVIGPYSTIRASSPTNLGLGLSMGNNSAIDAYSYIGASGFISIGQNVIMGQHVSFHAENHNYDRTDVPIKAQSIRREGIVIEDDCWVGSNVVFLDGAHVCTGCVIAAGAIVRGKLPAYSVAAGIPARVLRSRLPENSGDLKSRYSFSLAEAEKNSVAPPELELNLKIKRK